MQKNSGYDGLRFSYRSKVEFNATQDLLLSRSDCFLESKRARDRARSEEELKKKTPWDIRPPDFTLQIYQPKPPKRNSRKAMIPGYNEDEWNKKAKEIRKERVKFERIALPKILQPSASEKAPFSTQFRIPDSHTAKIMFVRNGIHKREPYSTPGPHAFRGDDFRPVSFAFKSFYKGSTITSQRDNNFLRPYKGAYQGGSIRDGGLTANHISVLKVH